MLKNLVVISGLISASQSVFAGSALEGSWRYLKMECSSGSPIKSNDQFTLNFSGILTFKASEMNFNMTIEAKMSPAYQEQITKQIQDTYQQLAPLPDSPEKQKAIEELKKSEEVVASYAAGHKCEMAQVRKYSVEGTVLRSTLISQTSTCDNTSNDSQSDGVEFDLNGNILKVISRPNLSQDGSCSIGDQEITIFEKM